MKLITAFIQPFMLDRVARQLRKSNIAAFGVTESRLFGPRCADSSEAYEPKMRLDLPVEDSKASSVVDMIHRTVEPDDEADFLLYVTDIENYILD